jgi:hypothetical protein
LAKTCPSEDHALHAWLLVWFTGRVVTGDVHASSLATHMTRGTTGETTLPSSVCAWK